MPAKVVKFMNSPEEEFTAEEECKTRMCGAVSDLCHRSNGCSRVGMEARNARTFHDGKRSLVWLTFIVSIVLAAVSADAEPEASDDGGISVRESTSEHEMELLPGIWKRDRISVKEYLRHETPVVEYRVLESKLIDSEGQIQTASVVKRFILVSPNGTKIVIETESGQTIQVITPSALVANVMPWKEDAAPLEVQFVVPADDVYEWIKLWPDGGVELAVGEDYEKHKQFLIEISQEQLKGEVASPESKDIMPTKQ